MNTHAEWLFEAPLAHEAAGRAGAAYATPSGAPVLELEGEFEWETNEQSHNSSAEAFATRVLPGLPEGHEVLTRAAAAPFAGVNLPALLQGVIRPDRGGSSYWNFPLSALHVTDPAEQRRHALRRAAGTSTAGAVGEIRSWLETLYGRAMAAGAGTPAAFGWIGEALHLIQDSYSQAHTERAYGAGPGGAHLIRKVRFYDYNVIPPRRTVGPGEHNFPSDERDGIRWGNGALKWEATVAIEASRAYLAMMLRHLASPAAPSNRVELSLFLDKHVAV